jgi:hypothetical protein
MNARARTVLATAAVATLIASSAGAARAAEPATADAPAATQSAGRTYHLIVDGMT